MLTHPYTLTRSQWRILFRHARTIAKGSYKTRYSAMQVALDHLIEVGFIPPTQLTATTEGGYWYTGISLSDAMYRYPIAKGCLAERLAFYKRQKQVA